MPSSRSAVLALVGGLCLSLVACTEEVKKATVDWDNTGTQQAQPMGLCTELAKVPERCADTTASACTIKLVETCDGFAGLLNPKLATAAAACVSDVSCDAAPTSCVAQLVDTIEPTDAQTNLAKAFCDACSPIGGGACETSFLSSASPLGKVILPLGDAIANQIAEECATGATCAATFPTCAQSIITNALSESLDSDGVECLLAAIVGGDAATETPPAEDDETDGSSSSSSSSSGGSSSGGSSSSSGGSSSSSSSGGSSSSSSGGSSSGGSSSGGTTSPPPTGEPTWDLYIESVTAADKPDGSAWDAFGGLPDLALVVQAQAYGTRWSYDFSGPANTKTITLGSAPVLTNVPSSVFTSSTPDKRLRITLVDSDIAFNDAVGDCSLGRWDMAGTFSRTSWSLGTGTVTCQASEPGGPGYTLRYRLVAHTN